MTQHIDAAIKRFDDFCRNSFKLTDSSLQAFLRTELQAAYEAGMDKSFHCGKTDGMDGAICGVKLDCHLHDWRNHDAYAVGQKEGYAQALKEAIAAAEKLSPKDNNYSSYLEGKQDVIHDLVTALTSLRGGTTTV